MFLLSVKCWLKNRHCLKAVLIINQFNWKAYNNSNNLLDIILSFLVPISYSNIVFIYTSRKFRIVIISTKTCNVKVEKHSSYHYYLPIYFFFSKQTLQTMMTLVNLAFFLSLCIIKF